MPDAVALLTEAAALAETALEARLPAATVEPARLHAAMRYAIFAGGKRLRPALVLLACRAVGGTDAAAAPGLAAVELLHTYTLVHDDLPAMDDDDLRRGRPTCHKAFDEATAILAGDALQTAAFAAAAELGAEAVLVLARDTGSLGVVGGQQDDLDAEGKPPDAALLERIHRRKTAALIRASCELGAIAGRATPAQRAALAAYGEALGLAFQIADDVLDVTATAATLGKTPGKDAAQGKLTYVAVHGLDAARAEGARQARLAQEALVPFGTQGAALAELARFVVERRS
jgi:geranylgeranyl diphosphate synthase type II